MNFTSSASGGAPPYSYLWNFGGAGTSAAANPSNTFNPTGSGTETYTVSLTVTDSRGCSAVTSRTVSVRRKPDASIQDQDPFSPWTFCDSTGGNILVIDNTSSTQSSNTNYHINWGDGTSPYNGSSLPNGTSHTYSGQGYFTVTLTVTSSNGCTATSANNVFVGSNPEIGLANPGGTVNICAPKQITFPITNFSNNPPGTTYTVTVNDGTAPVVYQHPPPSSYTHNFVTTSCGSTSLGGFANAFHVRIVADNPCGTTAALVEPIRLGNPPVADFTYTPEICNGSTILFTSTSQGNYNNNGVCTNTLLGNWTITPAAGWTLTSGSLSSVNPIRVNFTQSGVYNVQLIVSNPCGADTTVKPVCVVPAPDADFTMPNVSGAASCAGQNFTPANISNTLTSCGSTTYNWGAAFQNSACGNSGGWSFSNGNAGSQNPTFHFDSAGLYVITLAVTNACGTDSRTQNFTVKGKPKVSINDIPDICAITRTIFPSSNVLACYGTNSSYQWNFPGGTPASSVQQNPGSVTYSTSGTYTITLAVTNECGTTSASETFTNIAAPVANAGNDVTICRGNSVMIGGSPTASGGSGSFAYSWSNGSTSANPTVNPGNTTTYTVTVTSNGCTATDDVTVTVNGPPNPSITPSNPDLCIGNSVTLTASGGTTYTWSPGTGLNTTTGSTVIANPNSDITYTVTVTDGSGCSNTDSVSINVRNLPNITITNNPSICAGSSTVLTATGGSTYSWSPAEGLSSTTGSTVSASPTVTTSYTVTVTNSNGCSNTASSTITVNPLPVISVPPPSPICQGGSVTLTANGAASYTWAPPGGLSAITGATVTASPNQTRTYTVTGTSAQGCENSTQVTVTVNPRPSVTVNSGTICIGSSIVLNASGASAYSWSPATGLSATTGESVTANPTSTTTYAVIGTDGNGCTNTASATVTVTTNPTVDAGPDQTFCNQNIPIQLTGTPSGGTWSGAGVTSGGSFNPSVAGIGTYILTYNYTNAGGCSGSDNVTITVIPPTIPDAGDDFAVCRNAGVINLNSQLNPNPPGGNWGGSGVVFGTFTPSLAFNGPNTVTYTFGTGTCEASDVVIITVNPQPNITVNSPALCEGNSVTLTANGGTTYTWSPATGLSSPTGASVTATPAGSITYSVTGTDANGCTNSAASTVTVNPLPIVAAGPDQTFCNQSTPVQLIGTPGNGTWSGTGVTPSGIFNPAAAGLGAHLLTYTFTNSNGCTNSDVANVTVVTLTVPAAGNNFSVCRDAAVINLNVQNNPTPPGGTWSGIGVSGNNFNPAAAGIGQNHIIYAIGTGTCLASDTIIATVNALPAITVNSPAICLGDSATLHANGAITYNWSPAAGLSATTGAIVSANPANTTMYTVTGTDGNNCVNTTTATVTVNPLPVVDAGPDQTFCEQNIPVQLIGIPANGTWSGTGVSSGGSFNPLTAGVGTHQLTYSFTDGNSCTNTDVTAMTVIVPTMANAGSDFPLCRDAAPVDLNVQNNPTPPGGTWTGSGVSNNFFNPASASIGQNTIVYNFGTGTCLTRDTVIATVNPLPTIVVNSAAICFGNSATLTASGAVNYQWNPATGLSHSVGATVTASPLITTSYTVRGADANACVNSGIATVTVHPLPVVDAGPDQTFCEQNIPVQLIGIPANGTWSGTGVSSGGSFNPLTAGVGTHQLTYSFTDGNSCTNTDVTAMTVIVPTMANAGSDFPLCRDAAPVDLNVQNNPTPPGGTWTGSGVSNNFFNPASASIGQNTIVYNFGTGTCLTRDTVIATVNPLPTIVVNSAAICERGSVVLTASGANTYSWSPVATLNDSSGASVTASPAITTIYTVKGVDANSCSNSTTAVVTVNPLPFVDAGPDQTFCNTNTPVTFFGNPANGIWSGNGITPAGIFNPSQAGVGIWRLTYSLTDGNNCTNHDTTFATVVNPMLADAGPDVAICITGSSVDLTAIGATPAGGTWYGRGVSGNIFYPITAGVGQHVLTYSYGTETCHTTDSTSATVNPQPVLSVNSPEICFKDTAILTVFGADNYVWSPMSELTVIGGSTALAFPTATSAYIIIGMTAATGCSDTIVSTVTVHPLPVVDAGSDQTVCNQNFSTQLNANPTGGIWSGNFITPGGIFTPSGNPADTGSHTVTYSYTDTNSCSNSDNATVHVISPIMAVAGPAQSFCVDEPATILTGFTPPGGGTWSGNGIVNSATGLFAPSVAGVGSSKLFYSYGTGTCATRDSVVITINPLPTSAAAFNTTCIGDTTFFTDGSIANAGSLTSWNWDFGDGSTSLLQNPSHVYPNGTFTVTFSVANSLGCDDQTNLTVQVHPLPTVAFTHDSMICPDSALQIYLTAVDALNYYWDFGDGTTGSGINPTHSYSNVGVYQIELVAETQYGCTDSSSSRVRVPEPPNAFFTFNPKAGCAPLDVLFYPLLPPDWTGLRYMWIFGNGDTAFNPIPRDHITYHAGANGADTFYVVEFYVYSHTCQNFGKHADTVKVLNTPPLLVTADFEPGCGKTEVVFNNPVNTVFDSLFIDYGDGAAEVIPSSDWYFNHTFTNSTPSDITYIVKYHAEGATCNSIPGQIPVTVYPNTVKAGITLSPNDACMDEEFVLTNTSDGGAYFFYDLGTGSVFPNSNTSEVIKFQFSDTGTYVIQQYVYSADSCSFDKDSAIVHVRPIPVSDFQFDEPSSGCDGAEVRFTSTSHGSIKNIWDFGDNNVAVEADSPVHVFNTSGTYEVTLIAENEYGCKSSISEPVTVDFLQKGLYVPNAFSPEFGDPKVREFKPAGQCLEYYHLHIYNTWGELLWETYELTPEGQPARGWDGRHMNTGLLLPQDVYVWKIEAAFMNNSVWEGKHYEDRIRRIGSVTLLR